LVSRLANQQVKVVLTGDGGDEFFAGYTRYFRCMNHWLKQNKIPPALRPAVGRTMDIIARVLWRLLGVKTVNTELKGWKKIGEKLEKRAMRINAKSSLELFNYMMHRYKEIDKLVINSGMANNLLGNKEEWIHFDEPMLSMLLMDACCYLPDDILVKVDRATMANSLEARAPLLDKDIIEFAWQLPFDMKTNKSGGKKILKNVLSRYLPGELTERKKMGFGVPVGTWLRGSLREWAEDLLEPQVIKQQSYLDEARVRTIWKQHQSGWRDHSEILWSILMFQEFLKKRL
jgi:asparagine synthase (glutamine-hydrolysing)